jgi:hypothetical protein
MRRLNSFAWTFGQAIVLMVVMSISFYVVLDIFRNINESSPVADTGDSEWIVVFPYDTNSTGSEVTDFEVSGVLSSLEVKNFVCYLNFEDDLNDYKFKKVLAQYFDLMEDAHASGDSVTIQYSTINGSNYITGVIVDSPALPPSPPVSTEASDEPFVIPTWLIFVFIGMIFVSMFLSMSKSRRNRREFENVRAQMNERRARLDRSMEYLGRSNRSTSISSSSTSKKKTSKPKEKKEEIIVHGKGYRLQQADNLLKEEKKKKQKEKEK